MKKPDLEIGMTDHNHCKQKGAKVCQSGSQVGFCATIAASSENWEVFKHACSLR